MSQLTLIHTNDSHGRFAPLAGGGLPRAAESLKALLQEHQEALYVDAGDTVTAGNLGFRMEGEPVLGVLSDLGCAAMCLGNRETHPRKEIFPHKVGQARYPLLSANMLSKGDAPRFVVDHVILNHAGVRLGLFGVTVPMFTKKQWSQPLCDYWFDDPLKIAKEQIALLRSQVQVLVALTHIGHRHDLALAEACPQLDLVIGGHSHTDLDAPAWAGGVPVLQARSHGYYAGIAQMELKDGKAALTSWEKRPLREAPG